MERRRILRTLTRVGLLSALAVGCAGSEDERDEVGRASAAIVSGWDATWTPSVVALVDVQGSVKCTGTLVSDRAVLTAAHCDPAASGIVRVAFGVGDGVRAISIASFVPHPAFDAKSLRSDIALAVLAERAPDEIAPATLYREPIDDGLVGRRVVFIGYGVDGLGGTTARRAGLARVTSVEPTTFRTEPDPSQLCHGDSGGPALVETEEHTLVLGVVSSGDSGCAKYTTFTRLDAFLPSFVDRTLALVAERAALDGERCFHAESCAAPTSVCSNAGGLPERICLDEASTALRREEAHAPPPADGAEPSCSASPPRRTTTGGAACVARAACVATALMGLALRRRRALRAPKNYRH